MQNQEKTKVKALFVCAGNFCRSPTGEDLLKLVDGYETKSAGLWEGSVVEISQELLDWADFVFVMEPWMAYVCLWYYRTPPEKVKCLHIPDMYGYGSPKLIKVLTARLREHGIDVTHVADKFTPRDDAVHCTRFNATIPKRLCGRDCGKCWLGMGGAGDYYLDFVKDDPWEMLRLE